MTTATRTRLAKPVGMVKCKLYVDDEVFVVPWDTLELDTDPDGERVTIFEPENGPDPGRVHMVPTDRIRRLVEIAQA